MHHFIEMYFTIENDQLGKSTLDLNDKSKNFLLNTLFWFNF